MLDWLLTLALSTQGQWNPRSIEVPTASRVEIVDDGVSCEDTQSIDVGEAQEPLPCDVADWRGKVTLEYPIYALRDGVGGEVGVAGVVRPDGRFSDCAVIKSSDSNILDQKACVSLMQHARFRPAHGADGEPKPAMFRTKVVYRMPPWPDDSVGFLKHPEPIRIEEWTRRIQENYPSTPIRTDLSGTVGIRALITPNGRAILCEVVSSSGKPITDKAACRGIVRYSRFDPALDAKGKPTFGTYETQITYRLY